MEDFDRKIKVMVSMRVPLSIHREVLKETVNFEVLKNKRNKTQDASMTDAYLTIINDGLDFRQMKRLAHDPAKLKEFHEKYEMLFAEQMREEALERMDIDELRVLITMATKIRDTKFKQLLISSG